MESWWNRVILLLAGIMIAYFAVYFGDGIYAKMATDFALSRGMSSTWIPCGVLLGIVLTGGGLFSLIAAMADIFENPRERDSPEVITLYAATAFVCLTCLFGIVAGPFSNYGAYPWYWTSRWDWLPILAFIPTILVARDLFSEAILAHRNL